MPSPILTLQVPKGSRGIPVATSADRVLLRCFRRVVLWEARRAVKAAADDIEKALARLELQRLEKALEVLIPRDPEADLDHRCLRDTNPNQLMPWDEVA